MKLSVSLPDADVAFLDEYVKERRLESRSAALQRAVGRLRTEQLIAEYEEAFDEWSESDDAALWSRTAGDGLP